MSENIHTRARQLISQERVEETSPAERAFLAKHLQECLGCEEFARRTARALRGLRSAGIELPAGLTARTQFRVRLRAQELQEREPHRRMLWFACAISWVFGIASAPYVWRLFGWFGERTGTPKLVWEIGFGLWWAIPAVFVAIVLFLESARHAEEPEWMKPGH